MRFKDKIINLFTFSKRSKLITKLKLIIDVELAFTRVDFSLEFLQEQTGFDKTVINQALMLSYKQSFYSLTRSMRIKHLKGLISSSLEQISLNEYAKICGYVDSESMLRDLKVETGLDFEEFYRYASDLNGRIKAVRSNN